MRIEIQAAHETAQSKPTSGRSSCAAAGGLRRHLGSTGLRRAWRSTSPLRTTPNNLLWTAGEPRFLSAATAPPAHATNVQGRRHCSAPNLATFRWRRQRRPVREHRGRRKVGERQLEGGERRRGKGEVGGAKARGRRSEQWEWNHTQVLECN